MKQKKKTNVFSIILCIILSLVLVYNITIILQTFLYPDKTPSFFGIKTYVVASGSMTPTLEIGDIVVTKKVAKNLLEEGDIISFREGEKVVTHRINSILESNGSIVYKTKGDLNNTCDKDLVEYENIEGKLILKIPNIGNILELCKKPQIIIAIIVVIYIYIFTRNTKKERTEE